MALFIPLFISKIIKIIIINNPIPTTISSTYSLSIISSRYGFTFGKRNKVITYAKSHLDADKILSKKPFFVHFIKERIVKTKYTMSKAYKLLKISLIVSVTYLILKGLNTNSKDGNNVRTDIIANNIAIPVKTPK